MSESPSGVSDSTCVCRLDQSAQKGKAQHLPLVHPSYMRFCTSPFMCFAVYLIQKLIIYKCNMQIRPKRKCATSAPRRLCSSPVLLRSRKPRLMKSDMYDVVNLFKSSAKKDICACAPDCTYVLLSVRTAVFSNQCY